MFLLDKKPVNWFTLIYQIVLDGCINITWVKLTIQSNASTSFNLVIHTDVNSKNLKSILYAFVNVIDAPTVYYSCKRFLPCVQLDKFYWRKDFWYHFYLCKNQTKTDKLKLEPISQLIFTLCPRTKKKHWCNRMWLFMSLTWTLLKMNKPSLHFPSKDSDKLIWHILIWRCFTFKNYIVLPNKLVLNFSSINRSP